MEEYIKINKINEIVENVSSLTNYKEDGLYLVTDKNGSWIAMANGIGKNFAVINTLPINGYVPILSKDIKEENEKAIQKVKDECRISMDELNTECAKKINDAKAAYDNPTRNGCGEWISGKRLEDIIKIMKG